MPAIAPLYIDCSIEERIQVNGNVLNVLPALLCAGEKSALRQALTDTLSQFEISLCLLLLYFICMVQTLPL